MVGSLESARRKGEEGRCLAAGVKPTSIAWGLGLTAAGTAILAGWMPGDLATGPRIGVGSFLVMAGLLIVAIPVSAWFVARFARPSAGRCPVGESCNSCGAFNLKPRQACRLCSQPVNREAQTFRIVAK